MSIEQFWRNLQYAKREIDAIDRVLVPGAASGSMVSLDLWLIPQAVEGFDSSDFAFLPDDERKKLENLVDRFVSLATQVNSEHRSARQEEMERAKADLHEIIVTTEEIAMLLGLDTYTDAGEYRVDKILDRCKQVLQDKGLRVVDLSHRIEVDSTGEESLWIGVIVPDELAESDHFFEETERIREELRQLLRRWRVDSWVYTEFWTESERNEEVDD